MNTLNQSEVDTGCFQEQCFDFGHNNSMFSKQHLGVGWILHWEWGTSINQIWIHRAWSLRKKKIAVMTVAKSEVCVGWIDEDYYIVGGINLWWGRNQNLVVSDCTGGIFFRWRNKQIFLPLGKVSLISSV